MSRNSDSEQYEEYEGCTSSAAQYNKGKPHSKPRRRLEFDPKVDFERRATLMKKIHRMRKKGLRIQVTFDSKGQPEGAPGHELSSWIGVLSREHVPIWTKDWRSKDLDQIKDVIWREIYEAFTVEDWYRKKALKVCGELAKGFRSDLYVTFVQPYLSIPAEDVNIYKRPPTVAYYYPSINDEDWEAFVRYRRSSDFQLLSANARKIRAENEYCSMVGRVGYRDLEQSMFAKTGVHPTREELWVKSRQDSTGQFKNQKVAEISNLIDEYTTQQTQGSFQSVGNDDILTRALGKPEHSGRVRGQGKYVKQSQYFDLQPGSSSLNSQMSQMQMEIAELRGLVTELISQGRAKSTDDSISQRNSFKASCNPPNTVAEATEAPAVQLSPPRREPKQCRLFVEDYVNGGCTLVALGKAWMESLPVETVHGRLLEEENVRVSITTVKVRAAALPIPTLEATTVGEAAGSFVAWPKSLVEVITLTETSRAASHVPQDIGEKKQQKKKSFLKPQTVVNEHLRAFNFASVPQEFMQLALYAHSFMRDGSTIQCPIPVNVTGNDFPIFVGYEDVYEFINFEEIGANCILVYLR